MAHNINNPTPKKDLYKLIVPQFIGHKTNDSGCHSWGRHFIKSNQPPRKETCFNGFIVAPLQPVTFHEQPQFLRVTPLTVVLLLFGDVLRKRHERRGRRTSGKQSHTSGVTSRNLTTHFLSLENPARALRPWPSTNVNVLDLTPQTNAGAIRILVCWRWCRSLVSQHYICAGLINTPLQRGVNAAEAVETVSTGFFSRWLIRHLEVT